MLNLEENKNETYSNNPIFDIPWVEKYRPNNLSEVVGNSQIIDSLKTISENGNLPNLILSGPPGTGKTTSIMALAHELLGENFKKATIELNASDDRGISVVRDKIKSFAIQKIPLPPGRHKIIILDEADNMTSAAQGSMRVIISDYSNTTRFVLACNDSSKIIEPIQSRCSLLRFSKLKNEEIKSRLIKIIEIEKIEYDEEGLDALIETCNGDMRYALNNLQSTFVGYKKITKENVYKIVDIPKPEIIKNCIDFCCQGQFENALKIIDELLNDGYNFLEILQVINKQIQDKNINDKIKFEILKNISVFKMRCLDGINGKIQVYSFMGKLFRYLEEDNNNVIMK